MNYQLNYTGKQIDDALGKIINGEFTTLDEAKKELIIGADGIIQSGAIIFEVKQDEVSNFQAVLKNLHPVILDLHLPVSGYIDGNLEVIIKIGEHSYRLFDYTRPGQNLTIGKLGQVIDEDDSGFRYVFYAIYTETDQYSGFAIAYSLNRNDIMSLSSAEMDTYLVQGGLKEGQLVVCSEVGTAGGYMLGHTYKFIIHRATSINEWKDITPSITSDTNFSVEDFIIGE